MKRFLRFSIVTGLSLGLILGCGARQGAQNTPVNPPKKTFKTPAVPAVISDPQQQLAYQLTHYWDLFDFTDSVGVKEPYVADAFANYCSLLLYAQPAEAQKNLKLLLQKTAVHDSTFVEFVRLSKDIIYHPNSPVHDDELYLYLVEQVIDNPAIPESLRPDLQYRREMLSKNRAGTRATNFSLETLEGSKRLYDYHAPYIILYFYNLGCPVCEELSQRLSVTPMLQEQVQAKKLIILSVCMDADIQTWIQNRKHPDFWIDGYDGGAKIHTQRLYDLKAIPCLYLLDKDHKVIYKDAPYETILQHILK